MAVNQTYIAVQCILLHRCGGEPHRCSRMHSFAICTAIYVPTLLHDASYYTYVANHI